MARTLVAGLETLVPGPEPGLRSRCPSRRCGDVPGSGLVDGLGWVGAGTRRHPGSVEERAGRLAASVAPHPSRTVASRVCDQGDHQAWWDLEITLGVPPEYKWEAFRLSDASGLMVQFDCYLQEMTMSEPNGDAWRRSWGGWEASRREAPGGASPPGDQGAENNKMHYTPRDHDSLA